MADPSIPRKDLRQDIELLRIVSAFGIVWYHAGRDVHGIGYGGLVVFLALSSYFAVCRPPRPVPVLESLLKRALRLLVPWAFWMVAFGVRNHFTNRDLVETDRNWFNGFLAGTNIHLWFLPYMFTWSVAIDWIHPRVRASILGPASGLAALAIVLTANSWRPWAEAHGYPTVQYCHGVAGILVGIFLGLRPPAPRWIDRAIILSLVGATFLEHRLGVDGFGMPYLVGIMATGWITSFPTSLPRWLDVRRVSDTMFGVYLVHPLYLQLFGWMESVPEWSEAYLAFAASFATIFLLRLALPKAARLVT